MTVLVFSIGEKPLPDFKIFIFIPANLYIEKLNSIKESYTSLDNNPDVHTMVTKSY